MYARAVSGEVSSRLRRTERWLIARRRALRALVILLTLFGIGFGYYAHVKGRFGRLKRELKASNEPASAPVLLIGGKEPLVLQRAPLSDGSMPELLSVTFLPGRGMEPLQITASIPGKGIVSLLQAPSVEQLAHEQSRHAHFSGASTLQVPWAGVVPGAPGSPDAVLAEWHGRQLSLPRTGETGSEGGLLQGVASEAVDHDVMPDGGSIQAGFEPGNFGNRWPSSSSVTVSALLSIRALDMKITVRNTGREAEPVGIGWLPLLILPSNSRSAATLRVPSSEIEEMHSGRATGHLLDVASSASDFSARGGKALGKGALDATYTHLRTGFLDNGPVLEVRDPASGVGLRMTALSQGMPAVHVATSPSDPGVLQMGFQNNLDDPFNKAWGVKAQDSIPTLQPGQALEWHVRFELLGLSSPEGSPL